MSKREGIRRATSCQNVDMLSSNNTGSVCWLGALCSTLYLDKNLER